MFTSAGGRGASVSACADLTNQLQCCWVDPACAWKKHWHSNCRLPVDGGGEDTTPCTVNWCKKVRGAWLASSYCMGFQNFVVSSKTRSLKKKSTGQLLRKRMNPIFGNVFFLSLNGLNGHIRNKAYNSVSWACLVWTATSGIMPIIVSAEHV